MRDVNFREADRLNNDVCSDMSHAQLLYTAMVKNKLEDVVQLLGKMGNWNNFDRLLATAIKIKSPNSIHLFLNLRRLIGSKEEKLSQFLSNKKLYSQECMPENLGFIFIAYWPQICSSSELEIIYKYIFPNLLQSKYIKSCISKSKNSDLFKAIIANNYQDTKKYLDEGAEVNAVDKDGDTPLHKSVQLPDP